MKVLKLVCRSIKNIWKGRIQQESSEKPVEEVCLYDFQNVVLYVFIVFEEMFHWKFCVEYHMERNLSSKK